MHESLDINIFEEPNYEAFLMLSETHCMKGEVEKGLSILSDFECMLRVDSGKLSCYVGSARAGYLGEKNPETSSLCFSRMCGEIYLPYYESMSIADRPHLASLESEASVPRQTLCNLLRV